MTFTDSEGVPNWVLFDLRRSIFPTKATKSGFCSKRDVVWVSFRRRRCWGGFKQYGWKNIRSEKATNLDRWDLSTQLVSVLLVIDIARFNDLDYTPTMHETGAVWYDLYLSFPNKRPKYRQIELPHWLFRILCGFPSHSVFKPYALHMATDGLEPYMKVSLHWVF